MDRKPPFALKRKLEPTTTFPRPKRPDTSAALWPCFLSPACIPPHPDNEAFELLEPIVVKDSKVLHLGCRDGALTFAIARVVRPEGHVVGVNYPGEHVDATQRLSEALRKEEDISNVSFVQVADFTKLPFATEAFDVVYACDVMARLPPSPNYANALQLLVEMERVVKPFGFIVSRDIAAMHFFPETDLGSLITRTLFRATGLHGWYGPQSMLFSCPNYSNNLGLHSPT
ncbi:hypothetical protein GGS24DRAFT_320121 [Hypoxylon argillaceum]|nr:hypothetical protein GGS24DRAFT_320121 [Hypoxylon argillaceum]